MTTQTRPDVDLLESLDFEPVCQIIKPCCGRNATWFGNPPDCQHALLFCNEHRARLLPYDRALCGINNCNTLFAMAGVTWRPL